jgi:hypothetical protein
MSKEKPMDAEQIELAHEKAAMIAKICELNGTLEFLSGVALVAATSDNESLVQSCAREIGYTIGSVPAVAYILTGCSDDDYRVVLKAFMRILSDRINERMHELVADGPQEAL